MMEVYQPLSRNVKYLSSCGWLIELLIGYVWANVNAEI